MKKIYLVFAVLLCVCHSLRAQSPKIILNQGPVRDTLVDNETKIIKIPVANTGNRDLNWRVEKYSPPVFFEKKDYADWLLTDNQDRISTGLWITRQDREGIFNLAVEDSYNDEAPGETLWAFGKSAGLNEEDYVPWRYAFDHDVDRMLNETMSIFLEPFHDYIEIDFHTWTPYGNGGGFSYTRSGYASWLFFESRNGRIIPGESDTIIVALVSEATYGGSYAAEILIKSDDPTTPEIRIPVGVEILKPAGLSLSEEVFNFGIRSIGETFELPLALENMGPGLLVIDSIAGKTGALFFESFSDTLTGESRSRISILCQPIKEGPVEDTLVFYTNSHFTPTCALAIEGMGMPGGILSIDTDTIKISMDFGEVEPIQIQLANTGENPLLWTLNPSFNKPAVKFLKKDYANYRLSENQDYINSDLIITRANQQGIFNIAGEESFQNESPMNTLWQYGLTKELNPSDYEPWRDAVGGNPPLMINNPISMVDITNLSFYDILFTAWTPGGNGGGFSYERTEVPGWLRANSYEGDIAPGDTINLDIYIVGMFMPGGKHEAYIEIISNDTSNKRVLIPVIVDVFAETYMSTESEDIIFENTIIGTTDSVLFKITNESPGLLEIASLTTQLPEYTVKPENLTLKAGKEGVVTVYFNPQEAGEYNDTLWINSNFADSAHFAVPLHGLGVLPPVISIASEPLTDTIESGDISLKTLVIKNSGNSDLNWRISNETPGTAVYFRKADNANWTLPENQDFISENLIIARRYEEGLFNIVNEEFYNWPASPDGTLWWRAGTLDSDAPNGYFRDAISGTPPQKNDTFSMYSIADKMYFHMVFEEWTQGGGGGGYAYTRTEFSPWLYPETLAGTVAPEDSVVLEVYLDAANITAGIYEGALSIWSNDPENGNFTIPSQLIVTGTPEMMVDDTLFFYETPNRPFTYELYIENSGLADLEITEIQANGGYSIDEPPVTVPAQYYKSFEITVTPQTTGVIVDTLYIHNNSDMPVRKVIVKGTVYTDPATFTPNAFSYIVPADTIIADTIVVKNITNEDIEVGPDYLIVEPGDSIKYPVEISTVDLVDSIYHHEFEVYIVSSGVGGVSYFIPVTLEVFNIAQTEELADTVRNVGYGTMKIELASKYTTYRNNKPSFLVLSSDHAVATVVYENDTLRITEVGPGETIITVRADDNFGHAIYDDFILVNNAAPVASGITDQVEDEGFGTAVIDLSEYFSDPENQVLTYSVANSDDAVVTTAITGSMLTVTEAGIGVSTITVTATDPYELAVSDAFTFTVNEVTGLSDIQAGKAFVYPNPSAGILYMRVNVDGNEDVRIVINDLNGRIVYNSVHSISNEPLSLDLSSLDKGLYIMSYTIAGKTNRAKITMIE